MPIYNATKGLKGTMFFLPLPLQNTIEAFDDLGINDLVSDDLQMLPDPELYILLDGRPTKDKVVWQTLVDVNDIKKAVNKLKETNWLYKNINENSFIKISRQCQSSVAWGQVIFGKKLSFMMNSQ